MNWYLLLIFISLIIFIFLIKPVFMTDWIGLCLFSLILLSIIITILTDHLFSIFLCLEIQTFTILIFIARKRSSIKSSEAALKYFILGALSSGIFLMGIWLIYFSLFSFNIAEINSGDSGLWASLGRNLIAISLFFKLGCAPFHYWILDVYESISWKTFSIIAILPKVAYISVIVRLFCPSELLTIIAILSIIIGTFGAFNQTKIKRLLGYSTINHGGFYLITLILPFFLGLQVSYLYFSIYLLSFLFLILLCAILKIKPFIIQLSGYQNHSKWLIITLSIFILSLSGVPPFGGFIIKWFTLWNLIEHNYVSISLILIFLSILTIAFYLNLIKVIFFQEDENFNHWNNILKGNLTKKVINKETFEIIPTLNIISFGLFLTVFLIYSFEFLVIIIEFFLSNFI